MAKVASKKQLRMFHAILNKPKGGRTARGDFGPPASIAQKYINDSKAMSKETKSSLPESKGQEMHGGKWEEGSSTHKKAKRQEELRGAHKAKKYAAHSKKAQQKAERAKKIAKKKYGSHLKKAMITEDELMEVIREHGVASIAEVDLAVLEVDGNISILSIDHDNRKKTIRRRKAHKIIAKQQ